MDRLATGNTATIKCNVDARGDASRGLLNSQATDLWLVYSSTGCQVSLTELTVRCDVHPTLSVRRSLAWGRLLPPVEPVVELFGPPQGQDLIPGQPGGVRSGPGPGRVGQASFGPAGAHARTQQQHRAGFVATDTQLAQWAAERKRLLVLLAEARQHGRAIAAGQNVAYHAARLTELGLGER